MSVATKGQGFNLDKCANDRYLSEIYKGGKGVILFKIMIFVSKDSTLHIFDHLKHPESTVGC